MKKIILLLIWLFLIWNSFANWEDVIQQEENQAQQQKIQVLNENFKLEKFATQDEFENVLVEKMYDKVLDSCNYNWYPYPVPMYKGLIMEDSVNFADTTESIATNSAVMEKRSSSIVADKNVSYWNTNLQKVNVDEPEILKLTKDYIAYFNNQNWKIYIIKSSVSSWKIDLNSVKITDTIKVPKLINKHNLQLFFVNNQLIVIWSRYSKAFNWQVTDLVFYKINNWKASFNRIYDVKWRYKDARIVNNKVYLITDYNFLSIARKICENYIVSPVKKEIDSVRKKYQEQINLEYKKTYRERDYKKIQKLREQMNNEIKEIYKKQKKNINKAKILEKIKKWVSQKAIDIYVDKNAKFNFRWKIYPIWIRTTNSALNNILFVPTNFDKLNIYDLKFNLVNIVDIDTKQNPNQYVIFWNISNWQIHMTTKSLYLINNYYEWNSWRCRPWLLCILPYFPRWDFTLIHKLQVNWFNLNYINSQIVPWKPINQYSMDEDNNWNFRIFTKYYYPSRATDLYVFDKNLRLEWKIQGIAPWEDFKSSRFIEDKAYLVTFKATDPLFVIDLKDNKNPKILWELKIPWYSLYLHPAWKVGSVQYLIWIWQEAEEVHWNRSLPKNVKVDVYKVDYSKTVEDVCSKLDWEKLVKCLKSANIKIASCADDNENAWECPLTYEQLIAEAKEDKNWNNIYVEQLYSYILWNEKKVGNWGSYTPVFDNPRTFVYDKDLKLLLLPVYLTEDKIEKRCYPKYDWIENERVVNWEYCNEYTRKTPYFIWVKWLKIDLNNWITEVLSKNYIDLYKNVVALKKVVGYTNWLSKWWYKSENHRVSYYKAWNDFVPFEINMNFLDIFKWENDKFIAFNPLFNTKIDKKDKTPSKKCFYKKPAPGTITCQMYCGKRWILENNKCIEITVSAACSCPWFDTKSQCEENCLK